MAVGGDVEVVEAVVVVVADAGSLAPGGQGEAGFGGDVGEGSVVVVVEEVAGGGVFLRGRGGGEFGAVDEEDVGPAVAVVVEDGDAGAGGLDDVALAGGVAVGVADGDSGFGGDVDEPGGGGVFGAGRVGGLGEERRGRGEKKRGQGGDAAGHQDAAGLEGGTPMAIVLRILPPSSMT